MEMEQLKEQLAHQSYLKDQAVQQVEQLTMQVEILTSELGAFREFVDRITREQSTQTDSTGPTDKHTNDPHTGDPQLQALPSNSPAISGSLSAQSSVPKPEGNAEVLLQSTTEQSGGPSGQTMDVDTGLTHDDSPYVYEARTNLYFDPPTGFYYTRNKGTETYTFHSKWAKKFANRIVTPAQLAKRERRIQIRPQSSTKQSVGPSAGLTQNDSPYAYEAKTDLYFDSLTGFYYIRNKGTEYYICHSMWAKRFANKTVTPAVQLAKRERRKQNRMKQKALKEKQRSLKEICLSSEPAKKEAVLQQPKVVVSEIHAGIAYSEVYQRYTLKDLEEPMIALVEDRAEKVVNDTQSPSSKETAQLGPMPLEVCIYLSKTPKEPTTLFEVHAYRGSDQTTVGDPGGIGVHIHEEGPCPGCNPLATSGTETSQGGNVHAKNEANLQQTGLVVSKIHAEISYSEKSQRYTLRDLGAPTVTQENNKQGPLSRETAQLGPTPFEVRIYLTRTPKQAAGEGGVPVPRLLDFHVCQGERQAGGNEGGTQLDSKGIEVHIHEKGSCPGCSPEAPKNVVNRESVHETLTRIKLTQTVDATMVDEPIVDGIPDPLRILPGETKAERRRRLKKERTWIRPADAAPKGEKEGKVKDVPPTIRALDGDNKGYQMLVKMGWKIGDSLGNGDDGIKEPISVALRRALSGLGSCNSIPMERALANKKGVYFPQLKARQKARLAAQRRAANWRGGPMFTNWVRRETLREPSEIEESGGHEMDLADQREAKDAQQSPPADGMEAVGNGGTAMDTEIGEVMRPAKTDTGHPGWWGTTLGEGPLFGAGGDQRLVIKDDRSPDNLRPEYRPDRLLGGPLDAGDGYLRSQHHQSQADHGMTREPAPRLNRDGPQNYRPPDRHQSQMEHDVSREPEHHHIQLNHNGWPDYRSQMGHDEREQEHRQSRLSHDTRDPLAGASRWGNDSHPSFSSRPQMNYEARARDGEWGEDYISLSDGPPLFQAGWDQPMGTTGKGTRRRGTRAGRRKQRGKWH